MGQFNDTLAVSIINATQRLKPADQEIKSLSNASHD